MIKLIAVATVALAFATTAEAIPRTPAPQSESMITQVREGCGVGRVRINGVCVTRRYGYYGGRYNRGLYGTYNRSYYGSGYRPRYYGATYRRYGNYGINRPYRPVARARAVRRLR
jgi:hypothetical protein